MKFALDTLETTKTLPTASILWRQLSQQTQALEAAERAHLIQAIIQLRLEDPAADWLRLSALHHLTGDTVWLARQSRLASKQTAIDAIAELLDYFLASVLSKAQSRTDLAKLINSMELSRLQALAEPMIGNESATLHTPGKGPRIAVYTPQIANPRHGGTLFTLNITSALSNLTDSIQIFSAQESEIPERAAYNGANISFKPPTLEHGELTVHAQSSVQIILGASGFSARYKLQTLLQKIVEYKPDVVIFVGSLSPLAYALWKRYPLIGLSINTLPPVVPIDLWLSANPDEPPCGWADLPKPVAHQFSFRFWPKGPVPAESRESLDIPEAATVMITAGFRLHDECRPPWSDQVLAFLDAHPTAWWVLLGAPPERLHPSLGAHPRVRPVPPKRSAASWYAMSDIYLNPPRIGGGGSVAEAMEQGLPVVSRSDCDGGDKIGGMAVTSNDAYFSLLSTWIKDRVAREAAGEMLRKRFHANLDISSPAALDAIGKAIQMARSAFEARRLR